MIPFHVACFCEVDVWRYEVRHTVVERSNIYSTCNPNFTLRSGQICVEVFKCQLKDGLRIVKEIIQNLNNNLVLDVFFFVANV